MVAHQVIGSTASTDQAFSDRFSAARSLGPGDRKNLAVQAMAGGQSIASLARQRGVSRKFVYQQKAKGAEALEKTFAPAAAADGVLFHLPVTQDWLQQFALAQVLIGHTSFRGVKEILEAVFDYDGLSLGSIHGLVADAAEKARRMNQAQDLSAIAVGAHDEIYQAGHPVLVGMDVGSTYCYLLAAAEQCDATHWGVHLLDLAHQGLHPDYTIADAGLALRAGQLAAWEDVPCHGDVFHAERDLSRLAYFLAHRAAGCTSARRKLQRKIEGLKARGQGCHLSRKLGWARKAEAEAVRLAEDVRVLADWMRSDVLSLAGPDLAGRRELFDFIVEELRQRESLCAHRIRPIRRKLQKQRDDLLAFVGVLDQRLGDLATRLKLPGCLVHAVCELQGLDPNQPAYWQRQSRLHQKLPQKFHRVETAVRELLADTPRASSIVENLNSRLRNYFFLRRHIGGDYLDLLRFFLNHRLFLRSLRPERVGKSPAELLNGQPHPHWLALLGYQRFSRN